MKRDAPSHLHADQNKKHRVKHRTYMYIKILDFLVVES